MPPIVLAAGIAAAGAVGGAAISSRGAGKSAKRQTEAATEAARLEDEAAKRAEAFQRQQAQQQWAEAEAVRKANYDQWASRQRALNAFRAKHGYAPTEIPAYVPSQDPGFVTAPPPGAPPPGTPVRRPPPKDFGAVDAYLPAEDSRMLPPAGSVYGGPSGGGYLPEAPQGPAPVVRRRPVFQPSQGTAYQLYGRPGSVDDYLMRRR